ncbi:C1 family peptidase [Mycoplasma miroungirhinis]|uniref:Aminopeptidase n=1 Tax=Mycoplasma miroungirhinis TaxID=754516 RepID=A0A6M4JDP8_9MOLU|nr:C1 family peptidase [Mycoplasma miroungirhinis]QJR44196.1 C1 family peptidase [Mycoplasma miroungirhinis]
MIIDNLMLEEFEKRLNSDKQANTIKNTIAKNGIYASSFNNNILKKHNNEFSNEIKTGDITNQESSGRCWIFASLNMARISAMEKLQVKDLEFSENYLYFFEKIEKANTFFENIIQYGLDLDFNDRLMQIFLDNPVSDGGYWEWYISLNKKYGIVPKYIMNETFHSENTSIFEQTLNLIAKKHALKIINAHKQNQDNLIANLKKEALYEIYQICVKSLGMPPKTFDFEYRDKDDKFHRETNLTPMEFYKKFVGEELDQKITLVSDPREIYPYGKVIESKYFKTSIEGKTNYTLNVPMEELKKATIKSILDNKSVWFGCDVSQFKDNKSGILDTELYDLNNVLGVEDTLTKAQKLQLGIISPNHAMNFIGVDLDEKGNPIKWKVENSWGDKVGKKGIFSMSDKWFEDFNFECVVDKKYVDEKYLKGLEEESIKLEAWDPLA